MKLYRRPNGSYLAKNVNEFLSIVRCIIIDANSSIKQDREIATKFLNTLKNNKVYSIETGKPITVKW